MANVIYIDLDGNYIGIHVFRNSLTSIHKICTLYCVYDILQKKIRGCKGAG